MHARAFGSLSPDAPIHHADMASTGLTERQLLATRLVRRANKGLRIKQEALAEDLGRDQSTINRWVKRGVSADGVDVVIEWAHKHAISVAPDTEDGTHKMRGIEESESIVSDRLSSQTSTQEVDRVISDPDRALLRATQELLMADASFRRDVLQFVRQRLGLSGASGATTGTDNGP